MNSNQKYEYGYNNGTLKITINHDAIISLDSIEIQKILSKEQIWNVKSIIITRRLKTYLDKYTCNTFIDYSSLSFFKLFKNFKIVFRWNHTEMPQQLPFWLKDCETFSFLP